ncbi:hypothetical protein STEG23_030180, partial [Scotinomys teguina]
LPETSSLFQWLREHLGVPDFLPWNCDRLAASLALNSRVLSISNAYKPYLVVQPTRCLALEVCPLPPMVSHGDFICHPRPCERYNHGTVVEFYCDPGYSLTSDYKYITCQYGEWFPSYQVYCIKSEQTWPSTHETLLTTWKIVAFTATSVLLVLLLVILARMFQTKFKTHFPPRGPPRSSSSDPDFVVVDGVPVMLPTYDEAVNGGSSALGPGYLVSVGQGCPLPVDDQSPPAYPGSGDTDTGPGESETSGSSELLQSLYSAPMCPGGSHSAPDTPDMISSTAEEVVSTSPGIDIADDVLKLSVWTQKPCHLSSNPSLCQDLFSYVVVEQLPYSSHALSCLTVLVKSSKAALTSNCDNILYPIVLTE